MMNLRSAFIVASVLAFSACENGPSAPPGPPEAIRPESGSPHQVGVGASSSDSLKVRVTDANGKGVPNVEVSWRTSSPLLAGVSPSINVTDARGYARAAVRAGRAAGTAEVSASIIATAGPIGALFDVVVVPGAAVTLRFTPPGSVRLGVGAALALPVVAQDTFGNVIPSAGVTWTSSNPAVAEVSSTGTVTAKTIGSTTVTAALGSLRATAEVNVNTLLFEDNFNGENGGRPDYGVTTLQNWQIVTGNVDLIGAGGEYNYFPGNGLYVDLDGFYAGATLRSRASFNLAPGTYSLRLRLAGSQRGDVNSATVTLGNLFSEVFTLPSDAPLTGISRAITVTQQTSVQLGIAHGGNDGFGLILDDVSLSRQ